MGTILGAVGATLFIFSYFLLQRDKAFASTISYSAMNFIAAFLMLCSLFYDWNIGALINNGFWLFLSLYGIYQASLIRSSKNTHFAKMEGSI